MKKDMLQLLLLGLIALCFSAPAYGQFHRQSSIAGGLSFGGIFARGTSHRGFNTPNGFRASGSGSGNGSPIWCVGLQTRIETPFSRRLKLGLIAHLINSNALQQEGSFPEPVSNMRQKITSKQHYLAIGGDLVLSYLLFPQAPFELRLGMGGSYIYRDYKYRDEFLYSISATGQATLVEEHFDQVRETTWGIPFVLRIGVPVGDRTTIGFHAAFRQYFNGDEQFVLAAEVGYVF